MNLRTVKDIACKNFLATVWANRQAWGFRIQTLVMILIITEQDKVKNIAEYCTGAIITCSQL